jgi:hypothetical protein
MKPCRHVVSFGLLLLLLTGSAYALNFTYFSVHEHTVFGDVIKFWHEDTLAGVVRSNECLVFMENPVFDDATFITTCPPDSFQNPNWDIIYNAPEFPFPDSARGIRERAMELGFYFDQGDMMQARAKIKHDTLRIWWTELGTPFDSGGYQDALLPDTATVYFHSPLRISGVVSTVLVIGASGRIGLDNDIHYVNTYGPPDYRPLPGHSEKFALVSENEIKVLNTPANGRENSDGQGYGQNNENLTDIALNGIFVALNESFTFDQQNVGDSGYVCTPCGCVPGVPGMHPPSCGQGGSDDRGTIYLAGSLMQKRRGYVHRTCCGSTGYGKQYRCDEDLRFWNFGLFDSTYRENTVDPPAIGFGEVSVGDTVWDTVRVSNDFVPIRLDSLPVSGSPLIIQAPSDDSLRWTQTVALGFRANEPGVYNGTLSFYIAYYDRWFFVPWSGMAHTLKANDNAAFSPTSFSLSAYPNPFNPTTTISFSLPNAEAVELKLFDITGRLVTTLLDERRGAGAYSLNFDAADLPSGIYFARLTSGARRVTQKLMLLK